MFQNNLTTTPTNTNPMNLTNIKDAPGTGADTGTDTSSSASPDDVYNYVMTILIILTAFVLFCYMVTNNYLNAVAFKPEDYPIGEVLSKIIDNNANDNPYCSRIVSCEPVDVDNISVNALVKLWFQTTQQTCYQVGGYALNKYFSFLNWGIKGEIPYDHIFSISFIRWVMFGIITISSMILMLCLVWGIFLFGWVGGLFTFLKPHETASRKLLSFFITVLLTIVGGWISIYPVIFEFFYLLYLFLFKQLIANPANLAAEFTKRMSNFIVLFVICAIIVAGIQLPPSTAAAAGLGVLAVGGLVHYATKK